MISIAENKDCLIALSEFENNFFDLAIVDPDYGLNEKISSGGTWASKYKKQDGILGGKPNEKYFNELFRVSKNQIIWGGNYFNLPPTRCFLIWNKIAKMDTLADCELHGLHSIKMQKCLIMLETVQKQESIFAKSLLNYINGY